MDWVTLRAELHSAYHEQPQKTARIDRALELIREGIGELCSLGHVCHLAEGEAPPRGFPRMMFHLQAAPRGHPVYCQEDIELLGEGWFPTLDEAKHSAGMEHQYRRGGIIPRRALPAITLDSGPTRLDREERRRK